MVLLNFLIKNVEFILEKMTKDLGHPGPPFSAGIMAVSMNFEVAGTDSTLWDNYSMFSVTRRSRTDVFTY